jgi:predicted DNA-binding transcriptional regulator YafY
MDLRFVFYADDRIVQVAEEHRETMARYLGHSLWVYLPGAEPLLRPAVAQVRARLHVLKGEPLTALDLLVAAVRDGREVWIDYVDAHGSSAQRVVKPVSVGGGTLDGQGSERFPLHRITAAAFVE